MGMGRGAACLPRLRRPPNVTAGCHDRIMRRVRFTYRVRVSATAERALLAEWGRCRWVWNQCVAESRQARKDNRECGPAGLDKMLTGWRAEHDWLRAGSSVAQKQTIRDFGQSRAKALMDRKNKVPVRQRAGLPQFRKRDRSAPTMNYSRQGFTLHDGRLTIAGAISLRAVWSRDLPSEPSSVRIYQDALGHWYASFVVTAEDEPYPDNGQVIGIDWGVKDIATTTSGPHDLPHPEFGKKSAEKLTRFQRQMARRKPRPGSRPSAGYKRAKRKAAKAHAKVAAQRQDTARKWAKAVVRDFSQIAAEDFRPKFLAKSTMARKAADAAIGSAKRSLLEMAVKHGRVVHLVNPAYTTMDCSECGARAKSRLLLSNRTYTCSACGTVLPRDKNSARVMLDRAGLTPAGADRVRHAAA
jgi:putative transposase